MHSADERIAAAANHADPQAPCGPGVAACINHLVSPSAKR